MKSISLLTGCLIAVFGLVWSAEASANDIQVAPGVFAHQVSPTAKQSVDGPALSPLDRRIIGGVPFAVSQVPWQVALAHSPGVATGNAYDRQLCGGTLVTTTLVISAAHCVVEGGAFQPEGFFSVISGRTLLSSSEGRESGLASYHYFVDGGGKPLYNPRTSAWDVVVLELNEPALGSPIKIAGPDETALWARGRTATISGWGATRRKGGYPDGLRGADIVVMPNSDCKQPYGRTFVPRLAFCAGTALGTRATCYGDSGGPLVSPVLGGGYRLVGNTQFGKVGCASAYDPNVYGRLAAEPVRGALQGLVTEISGTNIVGEGGQAPTTLTGDQARENAWIYVEADCLRWRACRSYLAKPCSASGVAFRCRVVEFAKNRRHGRFRCKRNVIVSAGNGSIERRGVGKWKCR